MDTIEAREPKVMNIVLWIAQVIATIFHISRAEFSSIGITISFGLIAAFIAYGRLKKAPIQQRI
ncbi:MAG: hypothetical protein HYZ42_00300 [Bacteroidetes bacterium]|nr:hypothetical protein [Bacteroidota bacterium]